MPKQQKFSKRSKSSLADLIFPVGRIHRKLRKGRYANRIGVGGAIFLASVLEYLVAEISEAAGDYCIERNRKLIIPRHISMSIQTDKELSILLKNVIITQGGVVPYVHSELLMKKRRYKKKSQKKTDNSE